MATSLIQRHKLKIKTRATKNLSAAIQQTKCSDCLQLLDSWDGCRAHPALCYSSNIDCWNDQISRNIPEKDRLGVTKSWEYQNMLKEELNSPNCNNSLLLINNHCLTKTWPALLSHVTRVTWHMSRAGRDRGERDTVSLASLLDAHWLLILESSWSVTKLRDGGVTSYMPARDLLQISPMFSTQSRRQQRDNLSCRKCIKVPSLLYRGG